MSDHDADDHDGPDHDSSDHGHSHYETPKSRRPRSEFELRTMALEAALTEKGIVSTDSIDAFVEIIEQRMGPHLGAQVVARAWVDPAYKAHLLADANSAIAELGIAGTEGDDVRVVENTPEVHNLVVCTLCSCYPWPLLGAPPIWYKSFAYRARAVAEPRAVLQRVAHRHRPDGRGPGVGFVGRGEVPRAARTPRGDREPERGRAGRPRHSRFDDRCRQSYGADGSKLSKRSRICAHRSAGSARVASAEPSASKERTPQRDGIAPRPHPVQLDLGGGLDAEQLGK